MDRIWQWAWDRYGARYSWVICAVSLPLLLQIYLVLAFIVVGYQKSTHYVEATVVTACRSWFMWCLFPAWARSAWSSGGPPVNRSIGRGHWKRRTHMLGRRGYEWWWARLCGP